MKTMMQGQKWIESSGILPAGFSTQREKQPEIPLNQEQVQQILNFTEKKSDFNSLPFPWSQSAEKVYDN